MRRRPAGIHPQNQLNERHDIGRQTEILSGGAATVSIEIPIEAPVERIWRAMIDDIRLWWRKDFLVCEGSLGMYLEPRIGGLLHERTGEPGCGFVWGTVFSFQPNRQLSYTACIAPPWGGPVQSIVQINLEPREDAGGARTVLRLTDSLTGHIDDSLLASLDDGWRQLYGEGGLKSFVEQGR